MKIKQKRNVNLENLIKWAWENNLDGIFTSVNMPDNIVEITDGKVNTAYGMFAPDMNTYFEITEDMEIDENTQLDEIVFVTLEDDDKRRSVIHNDCTISQLRNKGEKLGVTVIAMYYVQDDGSMTKIFGDGVNMK